MGRIVNEGKTYLTITETCEILGQTYLKVSRLIKEGKLILEPVPHKKHRRVTLQSVADYLASRRLLKNLSVNDLVLCLAQLERRVRTLEYDMARKKSRKPDTDSAVSDLLMKLETLKHQTGVI